MKRLKMMVVGLMTVLIMAISTGAAFADYGHGRYTYSQWLSIYPGETRTDVQGYCNDGTWAFCTGTQIADVNGVVEVWYDNTLTNGYIEEFYKYQNSHWRTYGSYWCDQSNNCQKDSQFN